MRMILLPLIAVAAAFPAWSADAPAASAPSQEQVIEQFRSDMQAKRSDIIAKNLTLTADQAAKFWPLFEQYQKEQNAIIEGQLKATQQYADKFDKLTDADSTNYVNALLTRDTKMHELRVKWLAKFKTVVPAGVAARVIQIDRRLSLLAQLQLSSQIPLVR
ncbi:hypothetical protein [Roseateles violae]|uniref:Uncharacterized protein n=1 Tax=Roseateles violae TaxID=3058042 RepID=A0ABT8DUM1_9BURK|nr:hypothetical protein [Pelomonas sp. PFR6]MDN3920730.1 hypothetical protein [Pelomonas sp. PFR6]